MSCGSRFGEKAVGQLEQNTSTVPCVDLTTASAPVIQVNQHGERLLDDIVGSFTLHLTNETNTARIMLKLRIVKPLFLGKAGIIHFCLV